MYLKINKICNKKKKKKKKKKLVKAANLAGLGSKMVATIASDVHVHDSTIMLPIPTNRSLVFLCN
jgi:hypothetical protein